MSVTLDIPSHILEHASNYATSKGISMNDLIIHLLRQETDESFSPTEVPTVEKFGLFLGSVTYMAEDFNDTPEEFREYIE